MESNDDGGRAGSVQKGTRTSLLLNVATDEKKLPIPRTDLSEDRFTIDGGVN